MKPAPFDYVRARSVGQAASTLADAAGDGKILAGGQSLLPVLALRMARPRVLVDINRIAGLATVHPTDGMVRMGALVRHSQLAEQREHPLLAEAARWIGHTAIRSRGTLGGSLAHADPAAELPTVAAALDATVHITGPSGSRTTTATEFLVGALETTLADDEVITAIDLPLPTRWGFAELSRRHGDFGLVTVVAAEVDGHRRIAIGGVGSVPLRPAEAEHLLNEDAPLARVAAAAGAVAAPSGDLHAPAAYRQAMTEEFTRRALAAMSTNSTA
ncbi:FAD binding domain-containing protein [Streptomyces sp. NPDC056983]|uniref:FAD binding domain-containing protein n=1 Tax=Streptomyces sp. NPDC056983 TaxID=3345987 RepID=UPI003626989E